MKFKMLVILSALVAVGLLRRPAQASVVSVSSSTVTLIAGGNSGHAGIVLFNNSANPVYYAKASSSATVAAGMVLMSSTSVTLSSYIGGVYGLAGPGSSAEVRAFPISR